MSVTEPRPPSVVASATVSPPEVKAFPLVSLSWTVTVEVVTPLATMEEGAALIVDWVASAGPGMKLTTALSVMTAALTVLVTVALPVVVADVNVAV